MNGHKSVKSIALCLCVSFIVSASHAGVTVVEGPSTASTNAYYIGNRPPLEPSPFCKLPIGSITPRGWLRHQLEMERDGMVGNLEEISPWLNFKKSAWVNKEGRGKLRWEELPYWLRGYGDLGYVLKDKTVIAEAKKWIEIFYNRERLHSALGYQSPVDFETQLN